LSPFSAFLLLQGIETLHLRMPRHCETALAVARHLAAHPQVAWVRYPLLDGDRYRDRAQRYLPRGAGGILTFGIRSGRHSGAKAGERFIESVQFLSHLANVGDAKTLVIHPASTTHQQMDAAQLAAAGVGEDLVRLSVGIETVSDIIDDLGQALRASQRE
jgi:O-acetylhomoserine (thiol)-lyase